MTRTKTKTKTGKISFFGNLIQSEKLSDKKPPLGGGVNKAAN